MRIAQIKQRSKVPMVPQFGVENGKLYAADQYEDGTLRNLDKRVTQSEYPRPLYTYSSLREIPSSRCFPSLQGTYCTAVRYSSLSGVEYEDYVSKSGITSGQRFRSRNGAIIRDDGYVLYAPIGIGLGSSSNNYNIDVTYSNEKNCVCRIIHESTHQFVVHVVGNEATGASALVLVNKANRTVYVIFIGQFSIHHLGDIKETETQPKYNTFLVMLNSRSTSFYTSNLWPSEDRFFDVSVNGAGSKVFVVGFDYDGLLQDKAGGVWARLILNMGPGPRATNYSAYSYCNQRLVVDFDSSLCEYDADGYLTAFSFVAQNPWIVGEARLERPTSEGVTQVQLNDNICVFRTTYDGERTFTHTSTKIDLPSSYKEAKWQLGGYLHTSQYPDHISLVSGRAFAVKEDYQNYLCLFIDNVGFEMYQNMNAGLGAHYLQRLAPNLPPILMKFPVDENFAIQGDPVVFEFPVQFGVGIKESAMLSRKKNTELVIPSTMYYPYGGTGTYQGITMSPHVAIVDVITGNHKVIDISEGSTFARISSVGVTDDKILLLDVSDRMFVLDEGPVVSLSSDKPYASNTEVQVTVTVDSPAEVTLSAFNGIFDNGTSSTTLTVNATMVITVAAKEAMSIHVTKCVALETVDEAV